VHWFGDATLAMSAMFSSGCQLYFGEAPPASSEAMLLNAAEVPMQKHWLKLVNVSKPLMQSILYF